MIDPIIIPTATGLESPGDTISREGHLDVSEFQLGGHDFTLDDGLDYDVAVTNTGEGFLATGIVRGVAQTPCDRCLAPAEVDIAGEVSCYYLRELPEDDDDDEEEYGELLPDGDIDLSGAIQAAIAMDLPYVVLCRDDCKGLCPTCGHNLNEGPCDCAEKAATSIDPMSPFAALAGFVAKGAEGADDTEGDARGR